MTDAKEIDEMAEEYAKSVDDYTTNPHDDRIYEIDAIKESFIAAHSLALERVRELEKENEELKLAFQALQSGFKIQELEQQRDELVELLKTCEVDFELYRTVGGLNVRTPERIKDLLSKLGKAGAR